MGKNQAYKAMQRARLGSSSATPEDVDDGMVDGSFHSPAWHAARLASLNTSHTITWEEFKRKQKEDEMKNGEVEADKDRMMREYRAQLDAERAGKLASSRHHHSSHSRTGRGDKESRKNVKKKKNLRGSSSGSSSENSDSERGSRRRSKTRGGKRRKDKHHRVRRCTSPTHKDEGPVPLSTFFGSLNR